LVRLAYQMQGSANVVSRNDIAESFGASRRTAERMRDACPQIEEINEPGEFKRWRLPPGSTGRSAHSPSEECAGHAKLRVGSQGELFAKFMASLSRLS